MSDLTSARHEVAVPPEPEPEPDPEFEFQIRDDDYDVGLAIYTGVNAEHALAKFIAGRVATGQDGGGIFDGGRVFGGRNYSALARDRKASS
jgi:hypothetical protein